MGDQASASFYYSYEPEWTTKYKRQEIVHFFKTGNFIERVNYLTVKLAYKTFLYTTDN